MVAANSDRQFSRKTDSLLNIFWYMLALGVPVPPKYNTGACLQKLCANADRKDHF